MSAGQDLFSVVPVNRELPGEPVPWELFSESGFAAIDYSLFDEASPIELSAASDPVPDLGAFVFSVSAGDGTEQILASVEGITSSAGDGMIDFTVADDDGSVGYAIDDALFANNDGVTTRIED